MRPYIVVTSINQPTSAVKQLARLDGYQLLVVGDKKTPQDWTHPNAEFLSAQDQGLLDGPLGEFSRACPWNHYARKNVGYLIAIANGSPLILETDDDNVPKDHFGKDLSETHYAQTMSQQGWVNVYAHCSDRLIWPRGFPLHLISTPELAAVAQASSEVRAPIQQFLADGDPDVDAIFRLLYTDETYFESRELHLSPGGWCPFNSQNTAWWPTAFPLLYLPSFVSFRMTDIWRSFVAQAILSARGVGISFRPPSVTQFRNEHVLMRDFEDEIPGYRHNAEMMSTLAALPLSGSPDVRSASADMRMCYQTLVTRGWVLEAELPLLDAWLSALATTES